MCCRVDMNAWCQHTVITNANISGLMENWLFAPQSFDLKKEARDYVAILLEMYLLCPTLRNPATNE